jgi:hypothetical protein
MDPLVHQALSTLNNAKSKAASMRLRAELFSEEEIRLAETEEEIRLAETEERVAEDEVERVHKRKQTQC